jgi:hypothetical protein
MKHLFAYCFFAASLLLPSVSAYGDIPITSLPFIISAPGTYILANNLSYSTATGDAIKVDAADVTIDLNGYYLRCSVSGNHAVGIYLNSVNNVRVKNGTIIGFVVGEYANTTGAANVNFGHVLEDVRFYDNISWAVFYSQSKACVVKNCQFIGGTNGITFFGGIGNRATNNVAHGETQGFISNGTNYFDSNYADSCGTGFNVSPTTKLRFNTTTNCTQGVSGGISEFANDE